MKGRLADVYVPALVDGALQALSRRLGNRATVDDPVYGRTSTLSSIEPLLEKLTTRFKSAHTTYRHIASATGVDRDVSEGILVMDAEAGSVEIPVAVFAERRRMREIELRVYYATGEATRKARSPLLDAPNDVAAPQIVAHVLEALRKGAVERVLAAFEESSRIVDPRGKAYTKRDGTMASFVSEIGGRMEFLPVGTADDGRNCCMEVIVSRQRHLVRDPDPGAMSFERGDSGLIRELRLYYEP